MSPEQRKKFNTGMGSLFIAIGVVAWGLTVYYAVTPNPPKPTPVIGGAKIDLNSCKNTLTQLGYTATVVANTVEAFEPLGSNPKLQLDKASIGTSVCKLQLKAFCMGEGCIKPGISFELIAPTNKK